jgi:hypothetical protein
MAEFKRRTLLLSTGKQIRLFGNSLAIGRSLEVGEGGAPNIFYCFSHSDAEKDASTVSNPYQLTSEELHEIADYNIRLWVEFKDNIRQHGNSNSKVFNLELPADTKKLKTKAEPGKIDAGNKKTEVGNTPVKQ